MKNGTLYAGRVKKAYARLRHGHLKPEIPESDDPLRRLAIGILGVGCSDAEAQRAINRALTTLVDWNEIRVSDGFELNKATGNMIPQGVHRCQQLIAALQSVFHHENRLSLDRLRSMGRREARHYLEQLDGVGEYSVASVLLWSLAGHAIPVNDRLLAALRDADLVNPSASRGEVQGFLERHISAAEAKRFCIIMHSLLPKAGFRAKRSKAKPTSRKKAGTR